MKKNSASSCRRSDSAPKPRIVVYPVAKGRLWVSAVCPLGWTGIIDYTPDHDGWTPEHQLWQDMHDAETSAQCVRPKDVESDKVTPTEVRDTL